MGSRWIPRITRPGTGGSGPPSDVTDHFAPRIIVGNVDSGDPAIAQTGAFRYIPDTGNGAGIATALSEAAALGSADVYVRPGTYDFTQPGAPVTPLTVSSGTSLRGAGGLNGITIFNTPNTRTQRLLVIEEEALVEDIRIQSFVPLGPIVDTGPGIVTFVNTQNSIIRRCAIVMSGSASRLQRAAIFGQRSQVKVDECILVGYDLGPAQRESSPSVGVACGEFTPGEPFVTSDADPIIDRTTIRGFNIPIFFSNIEGGVVRNCDLLEVANITGIRWNTNRSASGGEGSTRIRGPRFTDIRIEFIAPDELGPTSIDGVLIDGDPQNANDSYNETLLSDMTVLFSDEGVSAGATRSGLRVRARASETSGAQFRTMLISNFTVRGEYNVGCLYETEQGDSTPSSIISVKHTNVVARNPSGGTGIGASLNPGGVDDNIEDVGFVNCDFSSQGLNGIGIEIASANVTRTTIVACSLTNSSIGAVPIVDNGTLTEAQANQVT